MKKIINNRSLARKMMPWWLTVAVLFLCAFAVTFLSVALQPFSIFDSARIFLSQPFLILLNTLPSLLVLCFFYFLCGNVFFSAAACGGLIGLLSLINRYKIEFRDDPLVPKDIVLVREAFNTVGTFR